MLTLTVVTKWRHWIFSWLTKNISLTFPGCLARSDGLCALCFKVRLLWDDKTFSCIFFSNIDFVSDAYYVIVVFLDSSVTVNVDSFSKTNVTNVSEICMAASFEICTFSPVLLTFIELQGHLSNTKIKLQMCLLRSIPVDLRFQICRLFHLQI